MDKYTTKIIKLDSLENTSNFANKLSAILQKMEITPFLTIYLQGGLGSGKTTFTNYFLRSLGVQGVIKSPTYTIVEDYKINNLKIKNIFHMDCYRLNNPEELEYIGFRDYLEENRSIFLIEWPSKAIGSIPEFDIEIHFHYINQEDDKRVVEISLLNKFKYILEELI
ncbi:MAG: tRNA (adenosine(37)-N6)-threonylcarbamoyltransferase complex ATPase subunit type 1 TsaE [Psittacicella sp.]